MVTWISVGSLVLANICLFLWQRERRRRLYDARQAKAEDRRWREYTDKLSKERDQAVDRLSAIRRQVSES